jgi:hypothetical protein
MAFRIRGLDPAPFIPLYGRSTDELRAMGIERVIADAKPGFPDRVEVRDAEPGEALLLLNFVHQPAETPYRSSHAIFVREGAVTPLDVIDAVPAPLRRRTISLRAFDVRGHMVDADLVGGASLETPIRRLLSDPAVDYLHAHYAARGCYAARIERA